jgi:predicted lysophospholipase L1 biosynthesis ABC-type transport system permease subunit
VFGASLAGLVSHPVRYGWNWDVLVQAEGSYGSFLDQNLAKDPVVDLHQDAMVGLLAGQPAVAGWSEFGFGQIPVGGRPSLPVLGLERHLGAVEPPTTSGQPLSGDDQIELGAVTLRQLGKKVGDTITVGGAKFARRLTIVGTVTLPSFGVALADHVSLGQGAMLSENTLLALAGAASRPAADVSQPVFPSVAAIDLQPGTTPAQRAALIHRIVSANPDGTDGGTYELPPQLASSVLNAQQLGGQPLALAVGLAAAAGLSLAMTVLVDVRRRRHEFAVLKALGMTRRQVWAAVAWQTTLTLLIAVLLGAPLGVAAGRVGWRGFADSLGVVPFTEIPLLTLVAALLALVVAGNLLASVPAAIAARTRAALFLRAD